MEYYCKPAHLAHMMQQWVNAIVREGKFLQQMDPLDGNFTPDTGDYSPAALVFMDFTWRLAGVRELGNGIEWNLRPAAGQIPSNYRLKLSPGQTAEIKYPAAAKDHGAAECSLNNRVLFRTNSTVRLITDRNGKLSGAAGIASEKAHIVLQRNGGTHQQQFSLEPNQQISLT